MSTFLLTRSFVMRGFYIIWNWYSFVVVPLINIIISHAKIENVGAASGVLNTMIAIVNAMEIALIGSLFLGMIGVGGKFSIF